MVSPRVLARYAPATIPAIERRASGGLTTRSHGAGDNYALALAYFQTGLPDGGFQLLQGNMLHDMYAPHLNCAYDNCDIFE